MNRNAIFPSGSLIGVGIAAILWVTFTPGKDIVVGVLIGLGCIVVGILMLVIPTKGQR